MAFCFRFHRCIQLVTYISIDYSLQQNCKKKLNINGKYSGVEVVSTMENGFKEFQTAEIIFSWKFIFFQNNCLLLLNYYYLTMLIYGNIRNFNKEHCVGVPLEARPTKAKGLVLRTKNKDGRTM